MAARSQQKKKDERPVGTQRRRSPEEMRETSDSLLDDRTKRDIFGVIFIVAAVVFFLLAIMPNDDGLISSSSSSWIHFTFGIGCYVLPFVLALVGITFLVKLSSERVPIRAAIGLSLIYIALLGIIALLAPITSLGQDNPSLLFSDMNLTSYGGYIGSGIAWLGLVLVGKPITGVILGGVIIIGVIIIGFSISKTIELARKKKERFMMKHASSRSFSNSDIRIRRRSDGNIKPMPSHLMPEDNGDIGITRPLGYRLEHAGFEQSALPAFEQHSNRRYTGSTHRAAPVFEDVPDDEHFENESNLTVPLITPHTLQAHEGSISFANLPDEDEGCYEADDESFLDEEWDDAAVENANASDASDAYDLPWDDASDEDHGAHFDDERDEDESFPAISRPHMIHLDALDTSYDDALAFDLGEQGRAEATDLSVPILHDPQEKSPASAGPKRSTRAKKSSTTHEPPDDGVYHLPPFSLLKTSKKSKKQDDKALSAVASSLQETLESFGVPASVVGWVAGPTVTLFKVELPSGVRVNRIVALNDDIALALAAPGVRIFAPIPGTNYVGIEVPNATRQTVLLADVLKDAPDGSPLELAIGKDVEGNSIVSDLARMPHLLIGGTTGSGKSVSINAMIMSILMRATPDEVRFIMIDPKRVEFTPYNGIPHLYIPVVTEPKEASSALAWGVAEMERRLKVFSGLGVRNITQYNERVAHPVDIDEESLEHLPYIVIIIDELADLMMNVGKEVEFSISRIAQLARAAGIHLIVATQRPSTNVVTGLIKANITNRIAFNVASGIDSRVVLDTPGAENLIGLGDMLLSKPELAKPQRIQACYVSEEEIFAVVEYAKKQGAPEYNNAILKTNTMTLGATDPSGGGAGDDDPLIWEAADIVTSSGLGSTSNIQRRLKVGYARAGRIMDQLEEKGIVGPANGSRPREVLMDALEVESLKAFEAHDLTS